MGEGLQTNLFLPKILCLVFNCIISCQELLDEKTIILMVSGSSVTAKDF